MALANTIAYYDIAKIMAVRSFIIHDFCLQNKTFHSHDCFNGITSRVFATLV
jgi:hypothetical protein